MHDIYIIESSHKPKQVGNYCLNSLVGTCMLKCLSLIPCSCRFFFSTPPSYDKSCTSHLTNGFAGKSKFANLQATR